jgi:hypothetical protein
MWNSILHSREGKNVLTMVFEIANIINVPKSAFAQKDEKNSKSVLLNSVHKSCWYEDQHVRSV